MDILARIGDGLNDLPSVPQHRQTVDDAPAPLDKSDRRVVGAQSPTHRLPGLYTSSSEVAISQHCLNRVLAGIPAGETPGQEDQRPEDESG